MARKRSTSSQRGAEPTSRKRQRKEADVDADDGPSTRRPSSTSRKTSSASSARGRANSPSKNVTFPRNLEQGRTESIADHRHQSPVRSALRQRDGGIFSAEEEGYGNSDTEVSAFDEFLFGPNDDPASPLSSIDLLDLSYEFAGDSELFETHGQHPDKHVCSQLQWLQRAIHELLKDFPPAKLDQGVDGANDLFASNNRALLQYVGRLALGGPDGKRSWSEMLENSSCRHSLVWAVIGQVLKEQCFDVLWFGASPVEEADLRDLEQDAVDQDGFQRANDRATFCQTFRVGWTDIVNDEPVNALWLAETKVCMQLERMLEPFYSAGKKPTSEDFRVIVSRAVRIARFLRLQYDVVYYWPPTFKDEEFDTARMECLNMADMLEHSPYTSQAGDSRRPVLDQDRRAESQAIVQIVCFPGLQAYRKGGGELAKHTLGMEGRRPNTAPPDVQRVQQLRDGQYTGQEGIRTKTITKAAVHLKWGKQRLLTKEAGTSAHLNAMRDGSSKYVDDSKGHREFYDLYGDWVAKNDPKAIAAARRHERMANFDGTRRVKGKGRA